eukprot:GHVS01010293.1.p1 GENE.GHVS01010293.1~~GHVS01010293.1.p1  ORF type:complete len:159 (+),score=18.72 GHVS01010293.1:93-569(+)
MASPRSLLSCLQPFSFAGGRLLVDRPSAIGAAVGEAALLWSGFRHIYIPHQPKKVNRPTLPNRPLRPEDYRIAQSFSGDGKFHLVPPYPPRANPTLPPKPRPYLNLHKCGRKKSPLQWKNIEYKCTTNLMPKPRGKTGAWGIFNITRIVHCTRNSTDA